jgi:hypothetical protein
VSALQQGDTASARLGQQQEASSGLSNKQNLVCLCVPLPLVHAQVISQVPSAGEVCVRELADMQGEAFAAPTVVFSQHLGGASQGGDCCCSIWAQAWMHVLLQHTVGGWV